MAANHAAVLPAVGFHPHDAKDVTEEMLGVLAAQSDRPGVVAVGEIGLDYYRDLSPRATQQRILEAQLDIAVAAGKPVSVHSRGAEAEILEPLRSYAARSPLAGARRPLGIMHAFGGTLAQAHRFVDLGFVISITCTVSYPNNQQARELARELPLTSLVVETDSPHLPPQDRRGRRNEPSFVVRAAEGVAAARGTTLEEVARETTANARLLFGLLAPAASR